MTTSLPSTYPVSTRKIIQIRLTSADLQMIEDIRKSLNATTTAQVIRYALSTALDTVQ